MKPVPQKNPRPRVEPKYPLGVWVKLYADEPKFTTLVRTVRHHAGGKVVCHTRNGDELIVPRSLLPDPA